MFNKIAFADESVQVQSSLANIGQNGLMSFFPFIMIFIVFYFMLIRPQMKKQKDHQTLLSSLKRGEKIVTNSGIIGTVSKIEDDNSTIIVELAPEIKIKMLKSSITEILDRDNSKNQKISETR